MSNTEVAVNYPTQKDKAVGQAICYEAQLHALFVVINRPYPLPTEHELGEAFRMVTVLAHDLEYLANGMTDQYDAAEEAAQAQRLLNE